MTTLDKAHTATLADVTKRHRKAVAAFRRAHGSLKHKASQLQKDLRQITRERTRSLC